MISNTLPFEWDKLFKRYILIGVKIKHYNDIKIGYGAREISDWLGCELGYCRILVNRWIANFTDLENSREPDGNFGRGNAHYVLVKGDYVFIGTEYVQEQQVLLTRTQILYVLEQYKLFLLSKFRNINIVPDPIDVEYITEGKEAIEMFDNLEGDLVAPYYYEDLSYD